MRLTRRAQKKRPGRLEAPALAIETPRHRCCRIDRVAHASPQSSRAGMSSGGSCSYSRASASRSARSSANGSPTPRSMPATRHRTHANYAGWVLGGRNQPPPEPSPQTTTDPTATSRQTPPSPGHGTTRPVTRPAATSPTTRTPSSPAVRLSLRAGIAGPPAPLPHPHDTQHWCLVLPLRAASGAYRTTRTHPVAQRWVTLTVTQHPHQHHSTPATCGPLASSRPAHSRP
jgi:hypothetical protein